jgi:hypothetical protein
LRSKCHLQLILLVPLAALCLLPTEASGRNASTPGWIAPQSVRQDVAPPPLADFSSPGLVFPSDYAPVAVSPEELRNDGGLSWYQELSSQSSPSDRIPRSGGLLIVAVAASWLVTCVTRNRRRTVYYGADWTIPNPARPSLREEIELGLLRPDREVPLDDRVGAKR